MTSFRFENACNYMYQRAACNSEIQTYHPQNVNRLPALDAFRIKPSITLPITNASVPFRLQKAVFELFKKQLSSHTVAIRDDLSKVHGSFITKKDLSKYACSYLLRYQKHIALKFLVDIINFMFTNRKEISKMRSLSHSHLFSILKDMKLVNVNQDHSFHCFLIELMRPDETQDIWRIDPRINIEFSDAFSSVMLLHPEAFSFFSICLYRFVYRLSVSFAKFKAWSSTYVVNRYGCQYILCIAFDRNDSCYHSTKTYIMELVNLLISCDTEEVKTILKSKPNAYDENYITTFGYQSTSNKNGKPDEEEPVLDDEDDDDSPTRSASSITPIPSYDSYDPINKIISVERTAAVQKSLLAIHTFQERDFSKNEKMDPVEKEQAMLAAHFASHTAKNNIDEIEFTVPKGPHNLSLAEQIAQNANTTNPFEMTAQNPQEDLAICKIIPEEFDIDEDEDLENQPGNVLIEMIKKDKESLDELNETLDDLNENYDTGIKLDISAIENLKKDDSDSDSDSDDDDSDSDSDDEADSDDDTDDDESEENVSGESSPSIDSRSEGNPNSDFK